VCAWEVCCVGVGSTGLIDALFGLFDIRLDGLLIVCAELSPCGSGQDGGVGARVGISLPRCGMG